MLPKQYCFFSICQDIVINFLTLVIKNHSSFSKAAAESKIIQFIFAYIVPFSLFFFKLKERVLNLNREVWHGLTEFVHFHKLSRCVSSLHLKTAGWQVSKPVNWFIMSTSLWVSHLHVSVHHWWCLGFICKFKCNLNPN